MEELENEISTQVEENTVSLASAQALADALAKIEVYTPTTWVDNSSPDIDAEHLNKPEQAIKRVTDALNSAVDVIKDLQSQVTKNAGDISTVNNNLSNFHFYNDLSQLGLSEGASINNLLEKMPAPSVGVFYCLSKSITGLPFDTQCMVTIFKNGSPFRIEVQDIWSGRTYVAIYSGGTVGKFVEYALKSDLEAVKSKQINRYVSAEKNTDTVLSSYENKEGNFILQFTSNDTAGTIPTLTGSHLFIIEHFMVGNNSDSAIERAYSIKGKLIAWRFKQWWDKTWTAWENS